ncbi:MAG: DOMON-like domain-containing protein [Thiobacillaceae bacterium]|nr:DOMON-like domain-containing protein [Thiobacillaceae bacterium]
MITAELQPHPDTPCAAVERIEAQLQPYAGDGLGITLSLQGALDRILLPPPNKPHRADGLWRHTCAELFVRNAYARVYREFNFAPSLAWQCYDFDDYRTGCRPAILPRPLCAWTAAHDRLVLRLQLDATQLPLPPWRLNLAMVVETRDGHLSYWALAHPIGHADFHHPDAFVLAFDP